MPVRSLIVACCVLVLAGGARAQSLLELYDAARGYDATYLAARAQADSAQYRLEQVKALNRGRIGLGANVQGTEVDYPTLGRDSGVDGGAQINGTLPLYNRSNDASIDQAQRVDAAAQADLQSAEQDLILRVVQAYFNVLAAQDALQTTRANKTAIAEQLASAKRNFEVGTATITDTREAQARFDLARAQEIQAENALRNAQIALDQLFGRKGVDPQPLALPVQLPPLQPHDPDAWVALAEQSPPVRRARLAYEVAQLETTKARVADNPTIDLVGNVGAQYSDGNSLTRLKGTTKQAQIGLQLSMPLYAGYSIQNRVKETLSLQEKARNDVDAAVRNADQATRQAYLSVESGEATVHALEAAEASNQLALEATQLGYKVGVRVNIDVLNAQTQLYTTRRDLQRARYDVIVDSLKLRQVAGTLSPEDVAAVNRLLVPR